MANAIHPPRTRRPSQWRRIDIPAPLYRELEQEATIAGMSTQAYAAYILTKGIATLRAEAQIPFSERRGRAAAAAGAGAPSYCAPDSHDWLQGKGGALTCRICGGTSRRQGYSRTEGE